MIRTDDLGNGYKILQDTDGFCFGTDSVLLSDFVSAKYGQRVVDFCSGNGIIPILLTAKTNAEHITGIEIQQHPYELAMESRALNGLEDKIDFINDDLKNALNYFDCGSVDIITCNPPYMVKGAGFQNNYDAKTIARHEITVNIDDIAKMSSKLLRYGGKIYMVHRSERLCDVICSFRKYGIEPKRLQMVHPFLRAPSNLFLIEGISGGKPSLKMEKPIYIRQEV